MRKRKKPAWKRWQKITAAVAGILLVTGVGFLLFPTVSNFFGQQQANAEIASFTAAMQNVVPQNPGDPDDPAALPAVTATSYAEALEQGEIDEWGYVLDDSGERVSDTPVVFAYDLDALYRDSLLYNESLINNQGTVDTSDYASAALDMRRYGLSNCYGYLSAPSINLFLPVYLGASDAMMRCGAAHLSGTSLPVDQTDTNVAIAGHTGYIGRIFFDNIRRLKVGDTVTVRTYHEEISYTVIGYKVVPEDDTTDLYIQEGRQLLTLITCVYAGNDTFDRYLVICEKQPG